ncbi:MAG: DUF2007 domain-containing protein [Pseudomonadota bacterium]
MNLELLYTSPNALLVSHVRNLLEVAGIEVQMKNQYLGGGAGELPPTEAWPELWVAVADYCRARAVVEEFERDDVILPSWRCAHCGERVEGQFSVCWNCGASRTDA